MSYKQWLKGSRNQVTDSLSWDNYFLAPRTHEKNLHLVVLQYSCPRFSGSKPYPKKFPLSFHQFCYNCQKLSTVLDTITKQASAWRHWNSFFYIIGINNVFLDGISRFQQNINMSCFAQAIIEGTFSRRNHANVIEGEQSQLPLHMRLRPSGQRTGKTRMDHDRKTCFIPQERYRGYSNLDQGKKKQKALPIMVLRKMMDISVTHKKGALSQLCICAIFFAKRSCEYLKSTHSEDSKRTRILRLMNILFKKDGSIFNHNSPFSLYADLVAITFEFQKNNRRNRTVHIFKTNDSLLCPVMAWASTVKRI